VAADDFLLDFGAVVGDQMDMAEPTELTIVAEKQRIGALLVQAGSIGSTRVAAFARGKLGGNHTPRDRLARPQFPRPRRGPDDHAEPAAADVPAVDIDVDPGELIAAELPYVLVMHDAGHGRQVGSCPGEPPRGNHYLGGGQRTHHHSMSTCRARSPPQRAGGRLRYGCPAANGLADWRPGYGGWRR
jgi:hypothetical protein